MANNLLSPAGVKNTLQERLEENEILRYRFFRENFKETQISDPISKFEQNVKGKYNNELMYF